MKSPYSPSFAAMATRQDLHSTERSGEISIDQSKLIAFYLPQYHRVEENSEWWGPGFTEWTNVARGKPNYSGHYQPHIPRDFGFYDLAHPDVMYEQAEAAKLYGIYGFCFYYYWFSGRKILEKPLENFLKSDIDIKFCFCWANENWTRTWDGNVNDVLLDQKYAEDDDELFILSLVDYFKDDRYIRVNGKPLLVVYRAKEMPNPNLSFAKWRAQAEKLGFNGLHIAVVDFYDITTSTEVGADALVEFPPHKFNGPQNIPNPVPQISNPEFAGGMVDYTKIIAQSANRTAPDFKLYRGIIPSWDNTARRQNTPTIVTGSEPDLYGEWLRYLRAYTRAHNTSNEDNFIFINAWNEWGEGCHLEPDQKYKLSYLEKTLESSFIDVNDVSTSDLDAARESLFRNVARSVVRTREKCDANNEKTDEKIVLEMRTHRPVGPLARRIGMWTIRWPMLYRFARKIYILMRGNRG